MIIKAYTGTVLTGEVLAQKERRLGHSCQQKVWSHGNINFFTLQLRQHREE